MNALVVGGTGPTGPFIVNGLLQRGYKVTIFHRGTHEIPEITPEV
jgi:nucleoside-diphosphate-sugar epimerase